MSDFIIVSILMLLGASIIAVAVVSVEHLVRTLRRPKRKRPGFEHDLHHPLTLARSEKNPVMAPREHAWERDGVMNPAAVTDEDGKVHLFYRAIGADGVSRIGYAASSDGVDFNTRPEHPIFALPREADSTMWRRRLHLNPRIASPGGTWSGTEDPRAVVIDDRMYLSFSAFEGWHSLRIGVTSISMDDLRAQRWHWSPPSFLSAPNQVHKNWVLFPEKIGNKFAILHSISPKAEVAFVNDIGQVGTTEPYVESWDPSRQGSAHRSGNAHSWDNRIRGSGPPPVKTPRGWLVLYHANDDREPHKYKLGAMLLDLVNPSKVIARARMPILEPDAHYENSGVKPGIVYACGAVVRGSDLWVYYGAADNVICTAVTKLSDFLDRLMLSSQPLLAPVPVLA